MQQSYAYHSYIVPTHNNQPNITNQHTLTEPVLSIFYENSKYFVIPTHFFLYFRFVFAMILNVNPSELLMSYIWIPA